MKGPVTAPFFMMKIEISKAAPQLANSLSELAQRSKAHWGYPAQFMQAVQDELSYTAEDLKRYPTYVITVDGELAGFYQLVAIDVAEIELEAMFVEPGYLGQGLGSKLFRHAVKIATSLGFKTIKIQADPNAAEFYQKQGSELIGHSVSLSIAGRLLPLFRYKL